MDAYMCARSALHLFFSFLIVSSLSKQGFIVFLLAVFCKISTPTTSLLATDIVQVGFPQFGRASRSKKKK